MSAHAIFSPSRAERDLTCIGAAAMEAGNARTGNEFSDEGTAAHALAAMVLEDTEHRTHAYLGRVLHVVDGVYWDGEGEQPPGKLRSFRVDNDFADAVDSYVRYVLDTMEEYRQAGAVRVILLVEQKVSIGHITHEEGATGTSDAIIVAVFPDDTALLHTIDLKFGRGVAVEAEENKQGMMYSLGALWEYEMAYNITRVRITIHQPRISNQPSEWEIPVEQLREFGEKASATYRDAQTAYQFRENWLGKSDTYLTVSDKGCRFCSAKANCTKLAAFVQEQVGADFEVLTTVGDAPAVTQEPEDRLGQKMQATDLIEDWVRAVRAEVERRLLNGESVEGFKLVQGKRGARAWSDAEEAEKLLKAMRLKVDEMYDFKLISPTSAEKLLKDTPKRWNRITPLISQSEGKPSVAPVTDKRPALVMKPAADDFENLEANADLV